MSLPSSLYDDFVICLLFAAPDLSVLYPWNSDHSLNALWQLRRLATCTRVHMWPLQRAFDITCCRRLKLAAAPLAWP